MNIKLIANVEHAGKTRKPGEVLSLAETTAKRLVALKFAEETKETASDAKGDDGDDDDGDDKDKTKAPHEGYDGGSSDGGDDSPPILTASDVDKMTKDELALELSTMGIPFKGTDSHKVLIALLKDALARKQ